MGNRRYRRFPQTLGKEIDENPNLRRQMRLRQPQRIGRLAEGAEWRPLGQ